MKLRNIRTKAGRNFFHVLYRSEEDGLVGVIYGRIFGWFSDDGWVSWDRTFRNSNDAEDAIKEFVHEHHPDKVVKILEVK